VSTSHHHNPSTKPPRERYYLLDLGEGVRCEVQFGTRVKSARPCVVRMKGARTEGDGGVKTLEFDVEFWVYGEVGLE
jgi:hypothetical protein